MPPRTAKAPGAIWLCPGIGGNVVRVTEDDLRMTVSTGRDLKSAADAPASKHQFAPFNSAHDTLEWRTTKGAPFATIQRWFLSDASNVDKAGKPAQVAMLIVTRLNPACHVGYVDVHANAIANAMARKAADEHARDFDCNNQPMVASAERGDLRTARLPIDCRDQRLGDGAHGLA